MGDGARVIHAAGALVWRADRDTLEVLLVHRPRYDDWSWPKGKRHHGESLPACAVREVAEETGHHVHLGTPLAPVRYRVSTGEKKVAWYWTATVADPHDAAVTARPPAAACSPDEVDEARWVEAVRALDMITRIADREPLLALLDQFAHGSLRSWPVLLARHGRAKRRSAWEGQEATRPLTPTGMNQAQSLVPILAAYGIAQVISSPWDRCTGTMAPYTDATGTPLLTSDHLTESGAANDPAAVEDLLDPLLHTRQVPTAICTHRPVLPMALASIAAHTRTKMQVQLPDQDPYLRTAEVLIVHPAPRPRRKRAQGLKPAQVTGIEKHRGRA